MIALLLLILFIAANLTALVLDNVRAERRRRNRVHLPLKVELYLRKLYGTDVPGRAADARDAGGETEKTESV